MASWLSDIVTALRNLGGMAHYELIYNEISKIRQEPLPKAWKKTVQRAIQDHASESAGFKTQRLFYSVEGKGAGVWGLVGEAGGPHIPDRVVVVGSPEKKASPNPAWSRDELLLALDLYMRVRQKMPSKNAPEFEELSAILNRLNKLSHGGGGVTFRNVNGVYMKLMNFRRLDPEYLSEGKVGLARGNKDEQVVWDQFAANEARLRQVAAVIRSAVESGEPLDWYDEPSMTEAEEGRVLTRLHRFRERDRTLIDNFKKVMLKQHGHLTCQACGFNFQEHYGDAGAGVIDVHHTKPVHTLGPGDKTRFEDLALLCANCHRMVHSSKRWLTVDQVSALKRNSANGNSMIARSCGVK